MLILIKRWIRCIRMIEYNVDLEMKYLIDKVISIYK